MADTMKITSLSARAKNGGGKKINLANRAVGYLRVSGGVLELVHALDINFVMLSAMEERADGKAPTLKGKPIFESTKGAPVSFVYTIPENWPIEEDRGKQFPVTLTATLGATALTAMQTSIGDAIEAAVAAGTLTAPSASAPAKPATAAATK